MIISLNVQDSQKDRAITALTKNYGYRETIDDKPNPETPAVFSKRMIIEFIKNHVKAYETEVEMDKISVANDLTIT